jgi:hypothetical protein
MDTDQSLAAPEHADLSDVPLSAYGQTEGDDSTNPTDPGQPKPKPPVPPVQSFWDRLIHGYNGEGSRTAEALRGAARGAVNAVTEGLTTIGEGATFVDRKTGLGEALDPGFNADYDKRGGRAMTQDVLQPVNDAETHYLGKMSDDPLASFAESASQFMTGWELTGGLKALSSGKLAATLARGALVDATMFDPYQQQLAELAAKAPIPIAKQLGQLLSVKGDDGAVVARLKRAAAGMVPAATIDGLVAASRVVRAGRALADGSASAVADHAGVPVKAVDMEKASSSLYDVLQKNAQTVSDVASGEHVAKGQPFGTAATADGYSIVPKEDAGSLSIEKTPDSPIFADHVEASQQAESINAALNARQTAGQLDDAAVTQTGENIAKFVTDPRPENLTAVLDSPHPGFSYQTTPEDAVTIAQRLADRWAKDTQSLIDQHGEVHVTDALDKVRSALGEDVPRAQLHPVMMALQDMGPAQSMRKIATDYTMKVYGDDLMRLSDVIQARPHDPVAIGEFRQAAMNHAELLDRFQAVNSDAARALRFGQERPTLKGSDVRFAGEGESGSENATASATTPGEAPVSTPAPAPKQASQLRQQLESATPQELAAYGRIVKMSGGEPRNAQAILDGAKVIVDGRPIRKALEVFTNALLSGAKTAETVSLSGQALTAFEPAVRMVAGAGTFNGPLIREGADQLAGAFKYAKENLQVARQAFLDGRSVIDPAPHTVAIGGVTGRVIRTPGNALGAIHEFTKVTNYRAWVYARSLREGRASGLSGPALASYADDNVRAAFGPGGVAIVPDGLKYGQLISLSTPLDVGLGKSLQQFTNNALAAKFVAPFVKTSTNIFKYVWQSAPGLNLLNKQWRGILAEGGEEAAVIHARSAMATTLALYGYLQAAKGNLTGRGPSDPGLREMWLKDNQPYSLRVAGGPWINYQRLEPLSMALGLMADGHTIMQELGSTNHDAEQTLYASIAAFANNFASKTYMRGITDFGAVWGSDDPNRVRRYLDNLVSSVAVPQGVSQFNDDPYLREARDLHDAVLSRVPGYSEHLDPRYNYAGEPILKTAGLANRNFSPFTTKDASTSPVESALLQMQEKLSPFPQKKDGIDLTDRHAFDNGSGRSPYYRMMELLRSPEHGLSLRDDLTKLVESKQWDDMSPGADGFPGGKRMIKAMLIKQRHEQHAWQQVEREYPALKVALKEYVKEKGAAIRQGQSAVQNVRASYGDTRSKSGGLVQAVEGLFGDKQ